MGGSELIDRGANAGPTTVADYAAILWRRKLLILPIVICVPLVTAAVVSVQKPQYRASADVLLRAESVSTTLALVPATIDGQDPQRLLDTQSRLARLPAVANEAIASGGLRLSTAEFLSDSAVSTDPNDDILTFAGTGAAPNQAIRLANAYARTYTRYRSSLDRQPVAQALETLRARLQKLRVTGDTGSSSLYGSLLTQQRQLLAIQALPSQAAIVVALATTATQTAPRLKVGIIVGLVSGMLLALAAALLREAIDKRPRSAEELPERLGLRVLGRIPATSEAAGGTVTLTHPGSIDVEAYRLLRVNFQDVAAAGGKVFAVTSAIVGEGKSTVSANLAVTLARSGRSVILVDCDPAHPVVRERFRVRPAAGLVEVALGDATVQEAITRIAVPKIGGANERHHASSTRAFGVRPAERQRDIRREAGSLHVVTCEPASFELGDFIVTNRLAWILTQLRHEADMVILDCGPLATSLGMGVSRLADGVMVVVNVSLTRRPILEQLAQALDELPTPKLGLVVTGVASDATGYQSYSEAAEEAHEERVPTDILSAARSFEAGPRGRQTSER
jgi:succinoglycan biosynthesis transport protein ExoP